MMVSQGPQPRKNDSDVVPSCRLPGRRPFPRRARLRGEVGPLDSPLRQVRQLRQNTVNILLAWVDGYYREENDPPIIDSDKYLTNAKRLGDYCRAHPEIGLITATDKLFEKK